jgi:two-component sensor histidine kinase
MPRNHIEVAAEPGIDITTDRAIPIGLVVNELVTNAAKHAYQGVQSGNIRVRGARGAGDTIELSVRDEGQGLPANFDLTSTPGLGTRIVRALGQQLGAAIEVRRLDPGTEFIVTIPPE